MSKDFILAKTKHETSTKLKSDIHAEDNILSSLYKKLDLARNLYPLMWKIVRNFYGNVVVKSNKLPILEKEIITLSQTKDYAIESDVLDFLKRLETLCHEGIKKRLTLWIIAD